VPFRDVEIGAWQDPEFIRPHENRGMPVRLEEGTALHVEAIAIMS
jgi:hypothetical protein